jgi:hypothetical protein
MPRPTIDLQRDCELFVDFDRDYFDSQRNKILDRSGNGRHPEASGGATLGVNGPDNFEAASFDGSDDFFVSNLGNDSPTGAGGAECTSVVLAKGTGTFIGADEFDWTITAKNSNVEYQIETDQKDFSNLKIPIGQTGNEFSTYVQRWDGDVHTAFLNDTSKTAQLSGSSIRNAANVQEYFIGTHDAKNDLLSGQVAFAAHWERALSDTEIEYLNRLTEPRRAQL